MENAGTPPITPEQEKIGLYLAGRGDLELGIVFGSVARGEAGPRSDLDIALAGSRPLSTAERITLTEELAELTGRPVDLIDLNATGGPILYEIITTGRRLFMVNPDRYAELLKVVCFDAADWLPLRRRIIDARRQAWLAP